MWHKLKYFYISSGLINSSLKYFIQRDLINLRMLFKSFLQISEKKREGYNNFKNKLSMSNAYVFVNIIYFQWILWTIKNDGSRY